MTFVESISPDIPTQISKPNLIIFQGFETRGTPISDRLVAYENLLDSVSHLGPLTTNPLEARSLFSTTNDGEGEGRDRDGKAGRKKKKKKKKKRKRERVGHVFGFD